MDESTFPYRVDQRTREFLADLVYALHENKVRLSSAFQGVSLQFLDKGVASTTIDGPLSFTDDGVRLRLPMNAVAKTDQGARNWLRQYHDFISRSKSANLTAIPVRCYITVDARTDGSLLHHITYMAAHDDGSLAQDMPQGKLYATENLFAPVKRAERSTQQASSKQQAGPAEPAEWLADD